MGWAYLDTSYFAVKLFIFEVQILHLIDDLAQFGCNFFFRIGNTIQLQYLLIIVLIDPLLILPYKVLLSLKKVNTPLEHVPRILRSRTLDRLAHLNNHLYMASALFDILILVKQRHITPTTSTRVPRHDVVYLAHDILELISVAVYFLLPFQWVNFRLDYLLLLTWFDA